MASMCMMTDFILFAVTATLFTLHQKSGWFVSGTSSTTSSVGSIGKASTTDGKSASSSASTTAAAAGSCTELQNSAFVFIKPHANTAATQKLVQAKLIESGCTILSESDIDGKTIDEKKLIDQHYYAIGTLCILLMFCLKALLILCQRII
jgi:hypothetical protein